MSMHPHSSLSILTLHLLASHSLALECLLALSYRSGNLDIYLTEIVQGVSRFIQSDWTIVTMQEERLGRVIASNSNSKQADTDFSGYATLIAQVIQSGQLLIIEDFRQGLIYHQLPKEYRCYLAVPLRTANGEAIGSICSFFQEPRSFADSEIKIVELFAERAATAIENDRLYQQQQHFNKQLSQEVTTCSIHLKQSQEKLIERERLAAIGEFTAMIVHEVRNPLTTIQMGLSYAQKVLPSDTDQQRLTLALSEAQRLNHLLSDILCYAKPQILELKKINISKFIHEFLVQVQDLPEAVERYIHYEEGSSKIEVMADTNKLKQVFLNLFRNAFEAIAPHETVSCFIHYEGGLNRVCIKIQNGGNPIPPELLPQLATPFCSTKPSGTGLGLALSKRIITAHQGDLEITSSMAGTTVQVYLPAIARDVRR
jgi:signal transduction histidine kinase